MVDARHAVVWGPSDSGKTTLLRKGHAECHGVSIWVNHNDESGVVGPRASGREAMHTAVGKYDSWEQSRINLKVENVHRGVKLAAGFAVDLWDTAGVPCQIIVDELHHLIPPNAGGPQENVGEWCYAEGRDNGIKFVGATQRPMQTNYQGAIGDAKYWVPVGEMPPASKGFRDYYGVPSSEHKAEQYHFTVLDRNMDVLHKGKTDESYA